MVLREKPPQSLEAYGGKPLAMLPLDITDATVATVARRLAGSSGTGGVYSISLQYWLLQFEMASLGLREIVREFGDWMDNGRPPWAANSALIPGRLIGINKCPGVRKVGMGYTWRRMLEKCVLVVTGADAKEACGTEKLCGGLEAGIQGWIHAVRLLWKQDAQEEDWGFLLVELHNVFNEEKRTAMLWALRHEWPSGARFTFNCYHHWVTLVIRAGNVTGHFLFSKELVTQGDPLAMVVYGLGMFPLIRELQKEYPGVTQPWYVDDSGVSGTLGGIRRNLDDLMVRGPPRSYLPYLTKSILVVYPWKVLRAEAVFGGCGIQIVTGSRYLGDFVASKLAQDHWLGGKVEGWQDSVATLAGVVRRHP